VILEHQPPLSAMSYGRGAADRVPEVAADGSLQSAAPGGGTEDSGTGENNFTNGLPNF
jgi:hypothetical protein